MLFNSFEFALFLPLTFLVYWWVAKNSLRWQNVLLLTASYVFYGAWDWRFLSLILISSFTDYFVGLRLIQTKPQIKRKILLGLSLGIDRKSVV